MCGKSLGREVVSMFSRSLRIAEVKGEIQGHSAGKLGIRAEKSYDDLTINEGHPGPAWRINLQSSDGLCAG